MHKKTNCYKTNLKNFNKDIKANIDINMNMNSTFNKDRSKRLSLTLNNVENPSPKNLISFFSLLPIKLKKIGKKVNFFLKE